MSKKYLGKINLHICQEIEIVGDLYIKHVMNIQLRILISSHKFEF